MAINENIKHYRKSLGLTQKEFAEKLNISDKTVSRWEVGKQIPDALIMPEIAKTLGITINDLYNIDDDTKNDEIPRTKKSFKLNNKILFAYKAGILISLVLIILGSFVLVSVCLSENNDLYGVLGHILTFSGCGIWLITEITYKIFYREKDNSIMYLSEDITYSGFSAIVFGTIFLFIMPLFLALKINYWYELFVMLSIIFFELIMLYYKNRLQKVGIKFIKAINITSIILCIASAISLLSIYIIFRIYDFSNTYSLSARLQEIYYVTQYGVPALESKVRLYSFLALSLPLLSMLIINYIELLIKKNRLTEML